ncbi:hypothetical protein [Candidatus Nitrotoga sp. BS]|uniref:hypothetical protein n=1 Tax=Candidatus Nitrotoga sp. BS TaxID=2890408 RepID=UPI001EF32498|nr:hypothetical protein [Candidatus Nitrotoga sp. BS]
MASRRKDTDLSALAARAERAKADGDPADFISGGLDTSDFSIILGGCVEFHPDVPEFERQRIVTRVSHDSAISRPITAESLLKQCSKLEQEYRTLPIKPFRLLTEISIWWTIDIPRTTVDQTTITFNPKTIRGFSERSRLFNDSQATVGFVLPDHYMRLSALVSARTPYEAAEKALNSIDLVRASGISHSTVGRPGGIPVAVHHQLTIFDFHRSTPSTTRWGRSPLRRTGMTQDIPSQRVCTPTSRSSPGSKSSQRTCGQGSPDYHINKTLSRRYFDMSVH